MTGVSLNTLKTTTKHINSCVFQKTRLTGNTSKNNNTKVLLYNQEQFGKQGLQEIHYTLKKKKKKKKQKKKKKKLFIF